MPFIYAVVLLFALCPSIAWAQGTPPDNPPPKYGAGEQGKAAKGKPSKGEADKKKASKGKADKKKTDQDKEAKEKAAKAKEEDGDNVVSANLAPAFILLRFNPDNVQRARVKDGKVLVEESESWGTRVGLEGHITFGKNWCWDDPQICKRKSTRVAGGPFLAVFLNGSELPMMGIGLLLALSRWENKESATEYGMNIGWGIAFDNSARRLPSGYSDGENLPQVEDNSGNLADNPTPEGGEIATIGRTNIGQMLMVSFNVGF